MQAYFAIAIRGTLGCWARYAMTNLVQAIYGRDFPYATLSINVLGSFLMGFLFIETLERLTIKGHSQVWPPTENIPKRIAVGRRLVVRDAFRRNRRKIRIYRHSMRGRA